jgi:hypothetical protein
MILKRQNFYSRMAAEIDEQQTRRWLDGSPNSNYIQVGEKCSSGIVLCH